MNVELKVAVVPMDQDFEVVMGGDGEIKISGGIEGRFLEMLSTYIGFTYRLVIPSDRQWGYEKKNGSWTGIIEMVRRGEANLALGYLPITEASYKAVSFSTPYTIADVTFVTNPPKRLPLLTTFSYPFSKDLWIGCIVLLLFFSMFIKYITSDSFLHVFFQMFGTFCKQPANILVKSKKIRYLAGSWSIFILTVTLLYSGLLPSFLTVSLKEKGFDSIQDLYEAVEMGAIKSLAPEGSSEVDALLYSSHHEVRRIGEKIIQNNWFYDSTNGKRVDHLQENAALVGLRLWFNSPEFETKIVSTNSFGVWNVGIAIASDFCCTKQLNTMILKIQSAGLFDKLVADEFFVWKLELHSSLKNSEENFHRFNVDDLTGVFRLLFIGYIAACLCFLVENVCKSYRSFRKTGIWLKTAYFTLKLSRQIS